MNTPELNKTEDSHFSHSHERKTLIVVVIAAITMLVEIAAGLWTNSMALLADGFHMASHVLALGLSWGAYVLIRHWSRSKQISFSKAKILALTGFLSAVMLQLMAVIMAYHAVVRFFNPVEIRYTEALAVAAIGLLVNILSAFILHHDKEHSDLNIRSAYLHVLADALTSVAAIIALLAAMLYNLVFLDALSAILSAAVITRWAIGLIHQSAKELIDFKTGVQS